MVHPFTLTIDDNLAKTLSEEQTEGVGGGTELRLRPEFYTTLAHGEEGGMPEDPTM